MTSIVKTDTITWKEPVFEGSFRRPSLAGHRTIKALVVSESYGAGRGQHTFSMVVIAAEGFEAPAPGKKIRRMGRNLYSNLIRQTSGAGDRDALLTEKHARGDAMRAGREADRAAGIF